VIASAISMIAWSMQQARAVRGSRLPFRAGLGAMLGIVGLGAHFGGSMTHGETYLTRFAPALLRGREESVASVPPVAPAIALAADEPRVFGDVVLPVLASHCVECHGAETAKSGLRLDSFAGMMRGGDDGPAVVVRSGAESPMVHRMTVPTADDSHMPPAGRRGPTPDEIALIRWWIDRGATESLRVRDGVVPEEARSILAKTAATAASSTPSADAGCTGAGSSCDPNGDGGVARD
jgi:mono/diheme cytochrome c family protein